MRNRNLRPRTDSLLRKWGEMIHQEPSGPGYDLNDSRQEAFGKRVDEFLDQPSEESFEAIWTEGTAVEHGNPGGTLLRNSFEGDVDGLAEFLETIQTAEAYNRNWEERLGWRWALWELHTRLNDSVPVVLTSESAEALSWFGVSPSGAFRDRIDDLEEFGDHYASVVGHPTEGTAHEVPVKMEIDELFHAVQTLDKEAIAPQIKGPYGDFYRLLYGGASVPGGRTDPVRLVDVGSIVRAYAWGKANGAYDEPNELGFWGGTYWETWKEAYADHLRADICNQFTLDDLSPEDIGPFFEALTNADASDLSKPVATYVMGSQWGQYTWNDIVDHFTENPVEASRVFSVFYDDSISVVNRLSAFKDHTIHLTETEDRSPGSIERMATALLMFTFPERHLGLPPARTRTFLEDRSTLETYESGFRPQQYRTIIGPLRGLRDELEKLLEGHEVDAPVTMLDVHSLIWIYGGEGEPTDDELPPADW